MKIAVTGVSGFVGRHLVPELVRHGHQVVGLAKGHAAPGVAEALSEYVDQDLALGWPRVECDAIVHLAGLSAVGPSFDDPQGYLDGNSGPMTALGEALLEQPRSPRVIVISTGAVYAPGTGLDESAPTQVSSPYVVSKLLVETQCEYYRRRGLDICVMRPFNHIGPGQQPGFLLPDLILGVGAGSLTAGNLATRRDYTDVRDVVRAYRLAVEAPQIAAPVLNVCSSTSVSGQALLELVASTMGVPVPDLQVDLSRIRPDDPDEIRGDNGLIRRLLGWRPKVELATTVSDTVADLSPVSACE